MRFCEDGPDIPDELLLARDEGRVVFFCGAGVSRAKAGLTDFVGLAFKVIDSLGVPSDHPILKVLQEITTIQQKTQVPGLISVDKIFGLLEREFLKEDIEKAVSEALKPKVLDASAHQSIVDLATSSEGITKIVTTNFDRLFIDCDESLNYWLAPETPDPSKFDGIVHLHGLTTNEYNSSEGEGYILSSSEFGKAYLSDGWATRFIKSIIDNYVIVFIGYTADDPPVQYLLEAINKTTTSNQNIHDSFS